MMAGSIIYCCLLMLVYTVPFTNSQQVAYVAFSTQRCTTLGVNEGSTFSICAYIVFINGSQSLPIDVSVHFRGINGSAKSGIDFIYTSIDRTFPAGSVPILNTSCVMIQTIGDMIVGATKTFTVRLSTNNSQVTIGDRGIGASIVVNIYNIDVSTVVMNTSTIYVNQNVAIVPICAVLTTGIVSTTISIDLATTSGTAMAPSDYTTFSGTVTIPANSIGICTSIAIVDDILVEGGTSNFTVKITESALVTVPANRSTTVITIIDIDVVTFGFWANNPSTVLEGSTAVQICVQIMNNVIMGIPVIVELRVIGVTAKNGTDFISPSAINITFWNGAVMGNLNCTSIIILQDSILEDNEDIFLSLNSYYRYVNISKTSANKTLTIIEDTDSVTLGFSNNIFMTNEGTGAPCLICIQLLAGALEKSIHAYVTTGILGTAQPYVDYIPLNLADIAFTSGASAKLNSTICINFTVIDDHVVENNETVPLSLSSISPVSTLQTSSTATVIIYDQMDYVQIGVTSSEFVTEGVNLTAIICAVILDGILGRNVVVLVNLMSFTANPGIDYEANSASFIFTNGQKTGDNQCFSVAIYHNVIVEDTEFFSANLTSLDPDVIISQGHGNTIITIYDDPDDKITFGMRSSLLYFKETDVSMPICVVLLSGQLDKNLPVGIVSTDVTAFAYRDFKPVNTTIIFNSSVAQGQSLCTNIYFIDDDVVEYSDEYFILTLIPIDTVHTVIQIPQAFVHIEEDTNDVVSIGVSYTKYNVYESLQAIVCAVILNGAVERPVSVFASSTSITAVENVDYQGVRSYELIFPPGSSENSTVCLNISTFNDTIIQPDRTFSIGLQKFDPSVLLSGSVSTVVAIKQNPIDRIVLRMQDATLIVTEGINTSVAVCVLLEAASGNLERTVLGMLTPINSTAKEIQDYVIPTNIVSFPALSVVGSPTSCISINIINDHLVGYTDFLQLLLLSTDPVVQVDSNFAVTTITIYEDPNDYIEVGMESVHLNIPEESSTVLVCVLITAGTLEDRVNVTLKTYPITAIDGKDYIGGEFILSFSSGQSMSGNNSQCIDFIIINDHLLENDESFLITLNTTREDASIVKVSSTHTELLLTILEIPPSDSVQIGMKPLYYQVVEGEQPFVTICAVLYDGELGRDLTVNLSIVNSSLGETALFGLNYLLQSQTLTFAYNELDSTSSTPCTNVTILDNNILENESYITIGLSVASEDRLVVETAPGMNQTIIAILDDDHDIVIGFDEPMLQVTEGINMSIFVCGFVRSQTGIWKMNLSAAIIQTDGAAKDMEDYIIPNYKITFWSWRTPGSTRWCVTVLIIDDDIVENSEQLTLKLVSTNPLVTGALNSSLITVNITEDPTDYVEIEMQYSFLSVIESNSTATVCAVITSGVLEKSVAVNMVTHPTTAIEGRDYIGGVFTLVFTPGQSSNGNNLQCIDLIIIDDHEFELDERLSVTLNSTPEFASVVRISLIKRELLLLILEITTTNIIQIGMEKTLYQEVEGETPFVTICALLYQGALARDLTVMLMVLNSTVGDTAIPGHDYILGSQTLTFMYDESNNINSTPCVNVTLLDDDIPENHLYVTIGLLVASIDSSDVLIVPGKNLTTILILDDDHGVLVGFNERVIQVNEAVNHSINICGYLTSLMGIWKSNLSSILVVTNSTVKELEDYILPTSTILFPAWSISGGTIWCQSIDILNDTIVEDSQLLILQLVSTNPLVEVDGNYSTITINITEDSNDYIEVQMQCTLLSVSEENATATVCAMITVGVLEKSVSVVLQTHSITAIDGKDYIGGLFTLTFTSGQSLSDNSFQCLSLIVLNDNTFENNETLLITLNSTQQDAGIVRIPHARNELLLTIIEYPSSDIVEIGMVQDYYEVVEGQKPFVTICAALYHGKLGFDVVVLLKILNCSLDDAAIPGRNYILHSEMIIFIYDALNSINTSCVNVTILDDSIPENTLYVTIGLFEESSNVFIIPARNQTKIAILDSDTDFVISMQYRQYLVDETIGIVPICVVALDTSPFIRKNVTFTITANGTATAGSDYIVPDSFIVDSTNAMIGDIFCFNVTIIDDEAVGNDLYFSISLAVHDSNTRARILPYNSTTEVKITEDTTDYVNIGFEQAQYIIYSWINSTLKICVQLTEGSLERDVTVKAGTEKTSNTTAIPGENYLPLQENITFTPNGVTSSCIILTILTYHSSSEKTVALFLITEDRAVHFTHSTTIVKIDSQSNVSILLTPRGTVIIITIWVILLPLCCLFCAICWILMRKKKGKLRKSDKVHPAVTKHDLELVSEHDRMTVIFGNRLIATQMKNDRAAKSVNDSSTSGVESLLISENENSSAQLY